MNCIPVESFVGFCNQELGYSMEKPFEVHVVSHKVKPASGVAVGVSVGDGEGVGLGLGTRVGVGMLVAVAI